MKITDEMLREAAGEAAEVLTLTAQRDYVPGSFVPSPEFQGRMEALLRRSRRPAVPTLLRRAAAAALVLLLGCGSWLTLDAKAQKRFSGWIREEHEYHATYKPEEGAKPEYSGKRDHYRLGWIPEGYCETHKSKRKHGGNVVYSNGKWNLGFSYSWGENTSLLITDTDRMTRSYVKVRGVPGDLWTSECPDIAPCLIWTDENGVNFYLGGFLKVEDLLRLAESIEAE